MTKLIWDATGQRKYEIGLDRGVLYLLNPNTGLYDMGYAWNGLTSFSESPSGGESTPQYADNIKYLDLDSAEVFGGTLEAFTYPDVFAECDGTAMIVPGVELGQQPRRRFGLSYRTRVGNDLVRDRAGYKIHVVYGCLAKPSEKNRQTINDSPEATTFSWELTTSSMIVENYDPSAHIMFDSTKIPAALMTTIENTLYGDANNNPRLPNPIDLMAMAFIPLTLVNPVQPTYVLATKTITIPVNSGLLYYVDGLVVNPGPLVITKDTLVSVQPNVGYEFPPVVDTDWLYKFA